MTDLPSLITRARSEKPYDRLVQELADELEKYVWRPIETAPKEEDDILVRLGYDNEIFRAHWIQYDLENGGWWSTTDIGPLNPTHWMPIPSAS